MPTKSEPRKSPGSSFQDWRSKLTPLQRSVHPGMIRTPLAENVINSKHYNQFTLEPETVAEAIVSQVLKGESAQLILPARYAYSTTIRGWPSWFQESARNGGAHVVPGSKEA